MIRESFTLSQAFEKIATSVLKLILDVISAYPYIILFFLLLGILGILAIVVVFIAMFGKWTLKFLSYH